MPPFPSQRAVFGTARSGPGRAVWARRRRIFYGFEKILRSGPWTARTVLKRGTEGKGGRRLIPSEDAGVYNWGSYSLSLAGELSLGGSCGAGGRFVRRLREPPFPYMTVTDRASMAVGFQPRCRRAKGSKIFALGSPTIDRRALGNVIASSIFAEN